MNEESVKVGYEKLSSSWIAGCEYDGDEEVLDVHLHCGKVYRVTGVSLSTYQDFVNAGSHGQFYNSTFKGGRYSISEI